MLGAGSGIATLIGVTARRSLDQLHEVGEGRPQVQVLRRLPVGAGGDVRPGRDHALDLGPKARIEQRGGTGLQVEDPEGGGKELLDFLLFEHDVARNYCSQV